MRGRIGIVRIGGERERGIYTESSRGVKVGSVNGVVVRENIGAVNASCLDRMIRQNLCLDQCREGYSFFYSLFSFQNLYVTLCLNSQKDYARPRRETTLRFGDESLNFEISDGLVRENNRLI